MADYVAMIREGKLLLVRRLDELKEETREVIVTFQQRPDSTPRFPGDVLAERRPGDRGVEASTDGERNPASVHARAEDRPHRIAEAAGFPELQEQPAALRAVDHERRDGPVATV